MLYQAKNGRVQVGQATMDYICFGRGNRPLIMIPGLGDGLMTVKGKALPFALMYRMYAAQYRVYVFSRGEPLREQVTTKDMAEEVYLAMQKLGIEQADIIGISQGGMIAQHLAIHHPDAVHRLILTVTSARASKELRDGIVLWMEMARKDDYTALMQDNLKRMYTETYLKKNPWMMHVAGKFGKPKSYDRFVKMAEACLTHDAYEDLPKITAPTLIISGGQDLVIGPHAADELKDRIPNAMLHIYPNLGHALYEEASDFHDIILKYLNEQNQH